MNMFDAVPYSVATLFVIVALLRDYSARKK